MDIETKILPPNEKAIELAAQIIMNDGLVAMPTETVYGLAANAFCETAVKNIYITKGRPQDNPLILHISNLDMLGVVAGEISELSLRLAKRFWPGPLTIIFPKNENVPHGTNAGMDTVAVRMPANETALKLIEKCGVPLAAPSANSSGKPSPTSAQHVFDDLASKIPLILDGGNCECGVESTVVLPEGDTVRVLRPGGISVEELMQVAPVVVDSAVTGELPPQTQPLSPGTKYKHYSPNAQVILVTGDVQSFNRFCEESCVEGDIALIQDGEHPPKVQHLVYGNTAEVQARNVFSLLRTADKIGAKRIFVHTPEKNGIGLAVYNRLLRAAAFQEIDAKLGDKSV